MINMKHNKGVALIMVILLSAILLIGITTLLVRARLSYKMTTQYFQRLKNQYVLEAGVTHAIEALMQDRYGDDKMPDFNDEKGDEGYDWLNDEIFTTFRGNDVDNNGDGVVDSKWISVVDLDGNSIGRYAILIEDEDAKVNINQAGILSNEGLTGYEVRLDRLFEACGIENAQELAKQVVSYRYGPDAKPGIADFDDNKNNNFLCSDGCDNNANGITDEVFEGVDELEEQSVISVRGDDKLFESLDQLKLISPQMKNTFDKIKDYLTVYNFFYESNSIGDSRVNINTNTDPSILCKILKNKGIAYPEQKAVNIIDFSDQNNVLSTLIVDGVTYYGKEAVQINEILAHGEITINATDSSVNRQGVNDWYLEQGKYTINNTTANDTWVFTGLAHNTAYTVYVYSDVPKSDGYYINNKFFDKFDEEGKVLYGVMKSDNQGQIEISCADDGDNFTCYFSKVKFVCSEFIELTNLNTKKDIDIKNWTIELYSGNNYLSCHLADYITDENCFIPYLGYVVIANNPQTFEQSYGSLACFVIYIPSLQIDAGQIILKDENGNITAIANISSSGIAGISMEKNDPLMDQFEAHLLNFASPGKINTRLDVNQKPREIRNNLYRTITDLGLVADKDAWTYLDSEMIARVADEFTTYQLYVEAEAADQIDAKEWTQITDSNNNKVYVTEKPGLSTWTWNLEKTIEDGYYYLVLYGKQGEQVSISLDEGKIFSPVLIFGSDNEIQVGIVNVKKGQMQIILKNEEDKTLHFDRICLAPLRKIYGAININTANKKVLMALPGMTSEIADTIIKSRPYQTTGEILRLEDMSISAFGCFSNLITTRSDIYKITCTAQIKGFLGAKVEKKVKVIFER